MKPKQKPFRFFLRREGAYELSLSVRFEVAEGYGLLILQRKDGGKEPPPTLVYEEREIAAKELRGGRFIHVLPGSSRRQSYALSRLTEEMLQQIPEEGWTEMNALTEYGFRYLVAPDNLPAAAATATKPATVQVSPPTGTTPAPAAARATPVPARPISVPTPPPDEEIDEVPTAIVAAAPGAPLLKAQAPGAAPSALQRAMAAIRAGRQTGATITGNTEALGKTPRPAPTAKVSGGGMTSQATRPSPPPADVSAADHLDREEAIATVKELAARLGDLERRYADSLARERDLLEILTRWQTREIG